MRETAGIPPAVTAGGSHNRNATDLQLARFGRPGPGCGGRRVSAENREVIDLDWEFPQSYDGATHLPVPINPSENTFDLLPKMQLIGSGFIIFFYLVFIWLLRTIVAKVFIDEQDRTSNHVQQTCEESDSDISNNHQILLT